ncbi:MAG: hypothetical protein OXJ62_14955 [Spirochaetaceae bacterium]|nr:hypothetical protein [Spirochaetaceae bacterium]
MTTRVVTLTPPPDAGAGALLLAAARAGGAPSRAYLADRLTGAERRALSWALRDDGDRPLTAERCREAAGELATMTPMGNPTTNAPRPATTDGASIELTHFGTVDP